MKQGDRQTFILYNSCEEHTKCSYERVNTSAYLSSLLIQFDSLGSYFAAGHYCFHPFLFPTHCTEVTLI